MQIHWQGHYLDGLTAVRQPVNIILTPAGIQIARSDGSILLWPYHEISQTQGYYAGEQVRLERGVTPVEALIVSDAAFLHSLRFMASSSSGRFHNPVVRKRRYQWIALAVIGTAAGLAAAYIWGIPAGARIAADHVPPTWEAKLGEAVVKQLAADGSVCTEPLVQKPVDSIMETLNSAASQHPYKFHITVVKDKTVNAFAAPGGHIVIFSGLLEQTKSAEELAGVLAHEMQHVLQKHATKGIFQNLSLTLLSAVIIGDLSVVGDVVRAMGSLNYSRSYEEEADYKGMELIMKAHINPSGMINFFEALNKKYGNEPKIFRYISTHPLTLDRIQRLKSQAKTASTRPVPLLPAVSWPQVAQGCGAGDRQKTQSGE